MKIDFRDLINLNEVILSHSTVPHEPGIMCTSTATTLLYENQSKYPREVRWLDCRVSPPKAASGTNITVTQQNNMWDMRYVSLGDKQLLITSHRYEGVNAYNVKTDKLEWKVDGGNLPWIERIDVEALSLDGVGHLFVADDLNKCVHVLSVADGSYLGHVLRATDDKPGKWRLRWCKSISCLVLGKVENVQYYQLKVVKVFDLPTQAIGAASNQKKIGAALNTQHATSVQSNKSATVGKSTENTGTIKIAASVKAINPTTTATKPANAKNSQVNNVANHRPQKKPKGKINFLGGFS